MHTDYSHSGPPHSEYVIGITRECKICFLQQTKYYKNFPPAEQTWDLIPGEYWTNTIGVSWGKHSLEFEDKLKEHEDNNTSQ